MFTYQDKQRQAQTKNFASHVKNNVDEQHLQNPGSSIIFLDTGFIIKEPQTSFLTADAGKA